MYLGFPPIRHFQGRQVQRLAPSQPAGATTAAAVSASSPSASVWHLPQKKLYDAAKPLTFGAREALEDAPNPDEPLPRVEDSFFLSTAHKRNPFTVKIHQMDNNPAFRREQAAYANQLNSSPEARLSKFALGSSVGYGLYCLSSLTDSTALGIAVGAGASVYFDDVHQSMVKLWHKPPHRIAQKAALEQLELETQTGRLVQELGAEWPRLVARENDGALPSAVELYRVRRHFADADEPAVLIGTALISRYPEQQDALKATLPKLRDTMLARRFILPSLRQTHHHGQSSAHSAGYGACQSDEENHPAMQKAVGTMLAYVDAEQVLLDKPINRHSEKARYENHLKHTLPRVIDYLAEE